MGLLALRGVASSTAHPVAPQSPFDRAQRARQALESRPEDERTKRDYDRVLDLYRAIYHDNPASPKADASIFAVAELLAEEGRLLHDEKSLNDAIGQYEFLRREYPASHYRSDALLAEGNIYLRDLDDRANAKATLQSFLKQYPHSPQTAEVRKDLKEIHTGQIAAATNAAPPQVPTAADISRPSSSGARPKHSNTGLTTAIQSQSVEPPPQTSQAATMPSSAPAAATPQKSRIGASTPPVLAPQVVPQPATSPPTTTPPAIVATDISPRQNPTPATLTQVPHRKGRLVQVTGVRHWSTSVYTRVAIDLGDEVQYEAARVPDPDRIFFDLHGARLSPELIGRSIDVTDDGFLKRIRAAQFSNDVTRIVLDVSDVSDYSAFLLPNPYRLIIDIHGRKPGVLNTQQLAQSVPPVAAPSVIQQNPAPRNPAPVASAATSSAKSPAASASNPSAIVTNRAAPAPPPAKPQPATVVVTTSTASPGDKTSAQDIASLGRQPDRVQATNHPTTAPIAASVAGTTPAQQPDLAKPPPTHNAKRTKATDNSQTSAVTAASVHEADPTAEGGRSMVRALGLKIGRIVVDAGHGGHDSGTLGPDGIQEKDVVLDVSLRLGKLLKQRLGADVIFTRGDDTFIPLETRTAIANKAQADLFVSVHANSSPDPSARGVETYYLNFTSSPESLELAARENAVSQQSIHQLSDLVKKIALHDKIDESREFASDVERYLYEGLDQGNPGLKDRGVKQAPFVVLIGANMPSILAEISFLTNPDDAHQLRDPDYRQRIAESLYRGVARYVSGLSGVRLAENSSQLP
jgi:N-acetylmuramoyl-L-alanine amidase